MCKLFKIIKRLFSNKQADSPLLEINETEDEPIENLKAQEQWFKIMAEVYRGVCIDFDDLVQDICSIEAVERCGGWDKLCFFDKTDDTDQIEKFQAEFISCYVHLDYIGFAYKSSSKDEIQEKVSETETKTEGIKENYVTTNDVLNMALLNRFGGGYGCGQRDTRLIDNLRSQQDRLAAAQDCSNSRLQDRLANCQAKENIIRDVIQAAPNDSLTQKY